MISYPLAALAAAGLRPSVVAKPRTRLPKLDAEVWREPAAPLHPLCGIVEALRRIGSGAAIICACDMPFVSAELVGWLAGLSDPLAIATTAAGTQPLLGRYSTDLAEPLAAALEDGRSMRATIAALGARLVAEDELRRFGDPSLLVANVNTRAELERAERLIAGRANR